MSNSSRIKAIENSIQKTLPVFEDLERILQESKIVKNRIYYRNKVLTSEYLRSRVRRELAKRGLSLPTGIIISSGKDSANPHHPGRGPIKPNSFIVCDIFPRDKKSGYFADITRTYVKGKPTQKMLKMFAAVKEAQIKAARAVKPGVKTNRVHQICAQTLEKHGFKTNKKSGFIHGTGHGLGLKVHEPPYLNSKSEEILKPGQVITIEPGLYYPKIGGVRLEDDILVTKTGHRNLVIHPKILVIN